MTYTHTKLIVCIFITDNSSLDITDKSSLDITDNSSLDPLLQGVLALIHMNLSYRGFAQNRTGDLQITDILLGAALLSTELK